jgi:hypothetical protein
MRHALQGLYDPATFLHSTCFSTNSDYAGRRGWKPPGMHHSPIPQLGPTAQEQLLSALLAIPSTESATPSITSPLLLQPDQLPGNRVHSSLLASAFSRELGSDVVTASDHFIERLFPSERLPFHIDQRVFRALANKGYWDRSLNSFKKIEYSQPGIQGWLNSIGEIMGGAHNQTVIRSWWHGTCNLPSGGAPMDQKPDLVLVSHNHYQPITARVTETC